MSSNAFGARDVSKLCLRFHVCFNAADAMELRLLLANPALFGRSVNGHEPRRPQQLARRVETTSFDYDFQPSVFAIELNVIECPIAQLVERSTVTMQSRGLRFKPAWGRRFDSLFSRPEKGFFGARLSKNSFDTTRRCPGYATDWKSEDVFSSSRMASSRCAPATSRSWVKHDGLQPSRDGCWPILMKTLSCPRCRYHSRHAGPHASHT
jgi:hypothetical protein